MAKAFGILLIVLGVWLGLEIFTKGTDGAFGGIFASGIESVRREPAEPTAQRIRNRVEQSMKTGAARSTAGVGDESPDVAPPDEEGGSDVYGSEE
jgi:hypothetical protein